MANRYQQIMMTPAVLEAQKEYFGRAAAVTDLPADDALTGEERAFIEARDSFYLATVTETGWPYVQHRGGAPGFLRVLGPSQLGFADYRGNRQLLSTGNLAADGRVSLFLMDYMRRERLKILGRARVVDARHDPDLVLRVAAPEDRALVERVFLIDVVSFDWNCPKYITQRFTAAEVAAMIEPLKRRIAELETELQTRTRP
jgi:hypothetical protein